MLLPCEGTGLNGIKRFRLDRLRFHLLNGLAILLFVWGIPRRFGCVQIFLSKYYDVENSLKIQRNGTTMVHSWQPRINCCSTVSPANAVKKKSRMTPFNTTICTQIRLIRDSVTIDQLLKSYLAQERRQLDLQEQYIQSDAQKAQFQSCYACKK